MALDESHYFDQTDYELELEVTDHEKGKADFQKFLDENQITYQKAPSKLIRFIKSMKKAEIISFFGKIEKIKIKESGFENKTISKKIHKVYRGRSTMSDRNNMKLFTLNSNHEIAQKIADTVGVPLGKLSSRQFSDGEIQVNIEESVRGYDVYIIQSTSYPVSNHLMELLIMVDACVRCKCS